MLENAEDVVASAGTSIAPCERARSYYRLASALLEGGRGRDALRRWAQATRYGLDARSHRLFLGKFVLGAIGARRAVERALWNQRTKDPGKS